MKIFHIGKKGNIQRYTEPSEKLEEYELIDIPSDTPASELLARGRDAEVIIIDAVTPLSAELIGAMPDLKLIQSEGVAFNAIDIKAAAERGIFVCNGRGMNASAVAEQTLLLMLGVLKDAVNNDQAVRTGRQIQVKEGYMARGDLMELGDCTIWLNRIWGDRKAGGESPKGVWRKNLLLQQAQGACGDRAGAGSSIPALKGAFIRLQYDLHPCTSYARNQGDGERYIFCRHAGWFLLY